VVDPGLTRTNAVQHGRPVVIFVKRIFIRSTGKVFGEELTASHRAFISLAVQMYSRLSGQRAQAGGGLRGDKVFTVRIVADTPLREFLDQEVKHGGSK
jgi:hypothetical protein